MPSIFSRSRTNSTPTRNYNNNSNGGVPSHSFDEFGRVITRNSTKGMTMTTTKDRDKRRDKDKEKEKDKRGPSTTTPGYDPEDVLSQIPDGSFLPLNLDRPWLDSPEDRPKQLDYGYLSYERHVILGLEQVARLVDVVADELGTRGLTTPFIFSTMAMDISGPAIKRLIQAFLQTCALPSSADAERRWREEARFSGPHELGTCLRWGLARVVRIVGGQEVRGLIAWDHYLDFRDSEAALNYPPAHFATFLPDLPPILQSTLLTLLSLLTRLTAHSASSGHTPPTLSPLFGPLLFGLGPAALAFHHTYVHYLRAVNGMEHILLAFIRWQDAPRPTYNSDINTTIVHGATTTTTTTTSSSAATALGVPTRLKDWIRGYPAMLPFLHEKNKNKRLQARRGVRTVKAVSVRRNVRMYSPDLVKTAASWAQRPRLTAGAAAAAAAAATAGGGGDRSLATSKEWNRIAPPSLKLPPRYSEAYKKKMDLPPGFHPDTGAAGGGAVNGTPSTASSSTSSGTLDDRDYFGIGLGVRRGGGGVGIGVGVNGFTIREGEDRFRSLTDLKWGEFESMGFGGLGADEKKLQFDLTESARNARAAKRTTLTWNDFSTAGFSRTDAPLNATLQFSTPITHTISSWPTHQAEIQKKLKKTQKSLPAFGWDTEPVVGAEEVIEEAFVDVFCDLVYGGGWMDMERTEETDRECNWALVEFKSLPVNAKTATGGSDPRIETTLILFEEFVPLEYRQQLAETNTSRRRLPSLFSSPGKSKQWKPAATLNGRPYVIGHVPRSPSYREVEFEGLLRGNASATKVISLSKRSSSQAPPRSSLSPPTPAPAPAIDRAATPRPNMIPAPLVSPPRKEREKQDSLLPYLSPIKQTKSRDPDTSPSAAAAAAASMTPQSSKRMSRFRLPGGIPVPSPGGGRKSGMVPSEYSTVDFETRLAGFSSDEEEFGSLNGGGGHARGESRDDAWVDILVANHSRRMAGQDAEVQSDRVRGLKSGRSELHLADPELASMEVAQALAGVRARSPPSSDGDVNDGHHRMEELSSSSFYRESEYDIHNEPVIPPLDTERTRGFLHELEKDPDIDSIMSHPRKRMGVGYFDLHPERRPPRKSDEEDPRTRLAEAYSDEEMDNGPTYSSNPPRPNTVSPHHIEVPEPEIKEEPRYPLNGVPEPQVLPQIIIPPKRTTSKTAALIEMYRERERETPTNVKLPVSPVSPLPSRLPVRSTSLAKDTQVLPEIPLERPAPPSPPSPEPEPQPEPPLNSELEEPLRVALDETGRASPGRYVHGAPLHNVLEEEEEE